MSVSKWAYDPDKCDGDYCVGDCDFCHKAADEEEVTVEEIVQSVRCKECKNRYTFDCPMCDDKTQDDDFCYMWQRERNEKCD